MRRNCLFSRTDCVFTEQDCLKIKMHWFTGSIPEAIGKSREKGLVFIVYIEGMSELNKIAIMQFACCTKRVTGLSKVYTSHINCKSLA